MYRVYIIFYIILYFYYILIIIFMSYSILSMLVGQENTCFMGKSFGWQNVKKKWKVCIYFPHNFEGMICILFLWVKKLNEGQIT